MERIENNPGSAVARTESGQPSVSSLEGEYIPRDSVVESTEFENHPDFLREHLGRIAEKAVGTFYDKNYEQDNEDGVKYHATMEEARREAAKLVDHFVQMLEDPATHAKAVDDLKSFVDKMAMNEVNETSRLMNGLKAKGKKYRFNA